MRHVSLRFFLAIAVLLTLTERANPQSAEISLGGQIDLLRLVDLAGQRLGLNIEYDASALKAASVNLRIDDTVSDEELWQLVNQMLNVRGFTSIEAIKPRSSAVDEAGEPVMSIVKIADAAASARVEWNLPLTTRAGYGSVLLRIRHRPLTDVSEAVGALLSKPAGAVQEVKGQNGIIISDLKPRLEQIIEIVQAMDSEGEASVVQSIEARNLSATTLAALVTAAATASNPMAARPLQGKLTPTPDDRALVLVAPDLETERWRELIAQFDRPPHTETRAYSATAFSLDEVAKLIEQTARDTGPRGSGGGSGAGGGPNVGGWRVVQDPLGGLLIITATPKEHEQIAALIDRLNALPPQVRRPVRAFPIRNRSVGEVVEVLNKMLEAGVLDEAEFTAPVGSASTSGPSAVDPSQLQRSDRSNGIGVAATQAAAAPTRPPPPTPTSSGSPNGAQAKEGTRPALTLTADEGTNTLIAVGDPRRLSQLEDLLRTIDVRQPQVMIEVLVVSLNEGDTLDLGVELQKIEISGDTVITLSSLFGLAPAAGDAPGRGFSGLILNPGDFRVLIRALQTINNGRSLNMPKVLVSNNQQANLDAVVQQPFVSTNASDTVATTSFGGFENAGTTITIKPQIAKGDHLVLEYSVSLSAFVGESSDPGIPPPRQQNNLQSVVTVPDGYTIVVGGIEITTEADAVSQVPLLGDVPLLGEAFKSRSRSTSTSRFYVFIRPTVLRQEGFEDLKYLSDVDTRSASVDDGWPEVEPRIIK
jgi:type II secretory pathway component GspD/PulD (secretin)